MVLGLWGEWTPARKQKDTLRWYCEWIISMRGYREGRGSNSGTTFIGDLLNRYIRYYLEVRGEVVAKPKEVKNSEWKGFVDVKLDTNLEQAFDAWDCDDEDVLVLLAEAAAAGHRVTLSYNGQNETYVASLTGSGTAGPNAGFTMSAFSGEFLEALRLLAFKHSVMCEGDWSKMHQAQKSKRG